MNPKMTNKRHEVAAGSLTKSAIITLREKFLCDPLHTDLSTLRPVIARSWQRSALCQVSPAQKTMELVAKPHLDDRILQTARPILDELERLCVESQGIVTLADSMGTIADFRGDPMMVKRAEKSFPILGGCMSEDQIGTNSEGTAIEEGGAVQVWGAEHFNDALQDMYCTSVPIRDPLRRSIRGVLSLAFPERLVIGMDPRSILLILQGAASQINSALAASLAAREQLLLSEYLRELRKRGTDAVIAMDGKTTIASRSAMQMLDQSDYAVLAGYAQEIRHCNEPIEREISCGLEKKLFLQARPVDGGDGDAGAVMRLRKSEARSSRNRLSRSTGSKGQFEQLIGNSSSFKRAIEGAATAAVRGISAYIVGETGTGKLLLANALAGRMGVPIRTHQCTALSLDNRLNIQQVSDDLANGGAVVFHRIDSLPTLFRDQLTLLLSGLDQPKVFMTFATVTDDMLPLISSMQGIEIQMPSLRIRRDDIPLLVDHFLNASPQPRRVSSRLLEVLAGAEWPGNVRQLKEVVEAAALKATGIEVRLDDLTEVHRRALARIRLSRLQRAELEQIREALIEAGGNRLRAAEILRIGRSTLYRKIDSYTVRGFEIEVRS
ncbi:transcriptional regulator of acetoin/glycerol metabolism [Pseudomonas brassicacearum]|uniref:Transcriptional regulator of acetoin/glycerol metabolism n=1 Tax=Pseudomonas brassicacearum TaxID=930166 RepID=A0AAW8M948_9PSED|nr:helix-turn-helix domain-containing protein [Pseudomonas brassicacearum]MDR6958315.1 transcriptional regulator of acetoin/glycerol metabolism [Pseudomonas brassicacearum]